VPHADVAGRQLHYLRRGSGPPLLLIQGMSGNHAHWGEPFLGALDRDVEVIAYDHRGMGFSERVDEPFSIRDLADDAVGLLDALGVERAHVMGISMGGMVAQELALAHPDRVDRLVLGCTYCGGPGSALTSPEVGMKLLAGMQSGNLAQALRAGFEVNVSAAYAQSPGAFADFEAMAAQAPSPVAVTMLQAQAAAAHDASARLAQLDVPTLVIHGDEDQMLSVANGRLIASLIPGARLEVLEGVGHVFWIERPEASAALVREHVLAAAPIQ
jgi:pimeloyl-ACP methyl ester carboxylesterase